MPQTLLRPPMTARILGLLFCWWLSAPLWPVLFLQAKRLRAVIPRLPAATGALAGKLVIAPALPTLRIAVVGESTAVGVGVATLDDAIPRVLAQDLATYVNANISWSVIGGNGFTVQRTISHISRGIDGPVDACVVLLGVNDVFRLTSIKAWSASIGTLVAQLARHGCRVIVFSAIPPLHRFSSLPQPLRALLGLRAKLLDQCLRHAIVALPASVYCDIHFPVAASLMATDGIHPSKAGYRAWAQPLATALSSRLRAAS